MQAVLCGDEPLVAERAPILAVEPSALILSAFKPAENGEGGGLRLSNPTERVSSPDTDSKLRTDCF